MDKTTIIKASFIDEIIHSLLEKYSSNNKEIEINFKEIFPELNNMDRYSHLIHPYPAKLLMHIPYFFLNNNFFSKKGDKVLDPFCGSGTVLLESILSGKKAYGSDSNPLARLISIVKTNKFEISELKRYKKYIENFETNDSTTPSVVNIDYWFLPHIKFQLTNILGTIKSISDKKYRDFFLVCFSNCVKKVSLADPRIAVPVRIKSNHYPKNHPFRKKNNALLNDLKSINVKKKYIEIVEENIKRVSTLKNLPEFNEAKIISDNAQELCSPSNIEFKGLKEGSIDLIITSPPYAGAQKYIRSSSLNIGWTELAKSDELKYLDSQTIGRENYIKEEYINLKRTKINDADIILEDIYSINPLRAHIAGNYLNEMKIALKEAFKVLKKGGYFIIVAANNQVCNTEFKTQEYLQKIIEDLGGKIILRLVDDIKSYGLMTKRNKTAGVITREWIIVFEK